MKDSLRRFANLSPEQRKLFLKKLQQQKIISMSDKSSQPLPIVPVSRDGDLPLSFSQQRLWFLEQLEPDSPLYNYLPIAIGLAGRLDVTALEQSLNEIIKRHQVLRTTFATVDGRPLQIIAPALTVPLQVVDLRELDEIERETRIRQLATKEAQWNFDLARGPLVRAFLLRLDEKEHMLLLTVHHIAFDGWSMGILFRELATLYQAFAAGEPSPLPELPIQYADFAHWQRQWLQGEVLETQLAYWKQQLEGSPPPLELSTDRPRPLIQNFRGAVRSFFLSEALSEALKALSQREAVTLFITLLAAFKTLLYRYTGQEDIVVGSPITNRDRAEIEGLIGFFVNTLALRTDLSGNPCFRELLDRVRKVALEAYVHRDTPFEKLVEELQSERDLSRTPLFQVMFALLNMPTSALELPGLTLDVLDADSGTAEFDLVLSMMETGHGLRGGLRYRTDLFDAATIARLAAHFQILLEGIVANPGQRLLDLPLLTEAEQHQLLVEWNDTRVVYAHDRCIHELFETQVERTPDAVAVVLKDRHLTYQMLNRQANQLAHHLQALGVGPESLVGVCVERSLEMVTGLLGILKAGGAYVPLDPAYPKERLAFVLSDSGASVLLTQNHLLAGLPEPAEHVVCLDGDWKSIGRESEKRPRSDVGPDNLVYVIYTSGSTGVPKGVLVAHRGVSNLAMAQIEAFGVRPEDRVLQFASLSFDASASEITMALCSGAQLYLSALDNLLPGPDLIRLLREKKITHVTFPPSVLTMLPCGEELPALQSIISAGEACPASLVERWSAGRRFFNAYGPTETSVCTTIAECANHGQKPPIGRPIANTEVYILSENMQPVPVRVVGELYVGGLGLARGYHNRPQLTAERFIPHPFSQEPGRRLYKTGDLVRYLPDGNVEFVGRMDHQVKVRGFRIELGEVEAVLAQHAAVREAVVLAREDEVGDKRLVAYVVPDEGRGPVAGEMHRFLRRKLPGHMVPSAFVMLEAFPLTPNGKVNRQALPAPGPIRPLERAYVAPRNDVERTITSVWQELLGVDLVGIHDSFFKLGGHSLLAMQLLSRMQDIFAVELSVRRFFVTPTVAGLAVDIAHKNKRAKDSSISGVVPMKAGALPTIVPAPDERYQPFPLTDVQHAYWIGRSENFELGNVATHVYLEFDTTGLDVKRLELALQRLIERHDMLRVVVRPDGQQQILEQVPPYRIEVSDLCGQDPDVVAAQLKATRERMSHQVLPADRWPLFEMCASRLDDRVRLHISIDALIGDAWSGQVLSRELDRLYQDPETPLVPLELSFRDYVLAEMAFRESELYQRSLDYWQSRLPTLPPAPELPLAKAPACVTHPRFIRQRSTLKPETWRRLKARTTQMGLTPSAVLLAAFAEVLTVWSKNPRFTINLTLFNRLPLHPQVNDIVGDFTSLTLLAVDSPAQEGFQVRARCVQEQLWESLDHRYVSGVRVLREMAHLQGGTPRATMPVVFTSVLNPATPGQDVPLSLDLGVLGQEASNVDGSGDGVYSISQTPQVWLDHQVSEQGGSLVFNWDTVQDLFPAGLVDDMFDAYCRLLRRLADEEGAWQETMWELVPVPAGQLEQRAMVNATAAPIPEELLHTLFAAQVEQRPGRVAVIASGQRLTYEELHRRSNRIGHWLREKGARPNSLVAVVMEKGWEQIVAVLGILQAGAAYLPISAHLPDERLCYLLENGEVEITLTQSWLDEKLAWPESVRRLCVDGDELEGGDDRTLEPVQGQEDLAYVIYTSGSTGVPKGVMIDHRGAVNTILDINQRFGVGPEDRVLALSSLSFDLSVYDIFGTLAAGGTIVVPDASASRDPAHWAELMDREQVTVWNSVPALIEMLVEVVGGQSRRLSPSLRLVLLSGDWIAVALPDQVKALAEGAQVISLGGATEASIWSILYSIGGMDPGWKSIPYGRPMVNQSFHVLDEALEPRPVWVPGQLYIGGIGLAQGYWRDEQKTRACFITHPRTGERLYCTGDLGRYLPDGNIEFLGREDLQVKIQGHRIELGEIEAALTQHPAVRAGVVTTVGELRGNKRLVAYIVLNHEPTSTLGQPQRLPEELLHQGDEPPQAEGMLLDPIERLKFKLTHPGLRREGADRPHSQLIRPELLIKEYATRRSYRKFEPQPILFEQFSQFLSCLLQVELDGVPLPKYRYGSAGSLYPVQTYLYVKPDRVENLAAGTYYYHPQEHRLVLLSADADIDQSVYRPGNRAIFDASAFSLFLIGQLDAITPMYGKWSRDFCMLEAGLMTQLLETSAPACQIGLCQVGGFDFEPIRHWFALGESHVYLHSLLGGRIDANQATLQAFVEDSRELDSFLRLFQEESVKGDGSASGAFTSPPAQGSRPDDAIVEELRSFLQGKLPEYMVPSCFVVLEALPLTPNGKVDRRALPAPDTIGPELKKAFVAPQTEVEQTIAAVWREVLQVKEVGIHDNFFDLGGNSVQVVQVHNKLRQVLDRDVSIIKLFEYPTIHSLAQYADQEQDRPSSLQQSSDRAKTRKASRQQRRQARQQRH